MNYVFFGLSQFKWISVIFNPVAEVIIFIFSDDEMRLGKGKWYVQS
jgi:hypothetical protein